MTSGDVRPIPVEKIRVDREGRQRREITDIDGVDGLADSIRRLGLIHPIVVTRDLTLVSGERRLTAVKSLGWDRINCQYTDELNPLVRRLIELEENTKRLDITWQEQRAAVAELQEIMIAMGEKWTQEQKGEKLGGLKQNTVSTYEIVCEEIDRGDAKNNEKILAAPTLAAASQIVQNLKERRFQASFLGTQKKSETIIHVDFCDWVQKPYDGPRFNFIHCDFPYGIETDKRQQGTAVAVHGGYDDSPENYWTLLKVLCANLNKLCTDSAHIMFWFHPSKYAETLAYFDGHSDFEFEEVPLVWVKSDKRGLVPDPQRRPRRIYETCLFGWRGDRKTIKLTENACWLPTDQSATRHLSPKPVPVLRHFFKMFVDEHSTVLDPTCGSGNALLAAKSLGAAHILGIEIDKENADKATFALRDSRRMQPNKVAAAPSP
jgi:ParB family chromosome partitioning protein